MLATIMPTGQWCSSCGAFHEADEVCPRTAGVDLSAGLEMKIEWQKLADAAEDRAIERYRRHGGRRTSWFRG
jgi:hypothetical protein